jgi:hypothetical protein
MIQELGAEHKAEASPYEWIHSGGHVTAIKNHSYAKKKRLTILALS